MSLHGFRDLIVYQKSYKLALEIFTISNKFPKEEKFSLVDQVRRSSRSVPVNIAEAWSKRIYSKAFINKLSDALGEEFETEVWIDMALDFNYIIPELHDNLIAKYNEIRRMLISMMDNPDKFCK